MNISGIIIFFKIQPEAECLKYLIKFDENNYLACLEGHPLVLIISCIHSSLFVQGYKHGYKYLLFTLIQEERLAVPILIPFGYVLNIIGKVYEK